MNTNHESSEKLGDVPGVFSLPTESIQSDQPSSGPCERHGASVSSWTEGENFDSEPAHHAQDDFPMIVWLRGDEPWFPEFDTDAEAAMNTLGIKRSRLTQIAGKELRVGRVRVDRYVKPVFRKRDIEQYLNQTRATASHQKSSEILNSAANQLSLQISRFEQRLEVINENLLSQINSGLQTVLTESLNVSVNHISELIDSLSGDLINRLAILTQENMLKHTEPLKKELTKSSSEMTQTLTSLGTEILQNQSNQESRLSDVSTQLEILQKSCVKSMHDLNNLERCVKESLGFMKEEMLELKQGLQQLQRQPQPAPVHSSTNQAKKPRPSKSALQRRKRLTFR